MMTPDDIVRILNDIKFRDWSFTLNPKIMGSLLHVQFCDGNGMPCYGRKWYISQYSTKSEVVQTVLKAILTALEHEAREEFTYQGKRIYGPHLDVDSLVKLVDSSNEDHRP